MMNSPTRDKGIERDFFTKGEDASVTSGEGMLEDKCISYPHCVCVVVVVVGGCDINEADTFPS